MTLLLGYGLGLGVPFLAVGLLGGWGLRVARGIGRHGQAVSLASGAMLLAMGVLVFSGRMTQLSTWMTEAFGTGFAV